MGTDSFTDWEAALASRGFRRVEAEKHEGLGNELVVMARPDLRVRFVRDRGQGSAEVASPAAPNDWFDAAIVMEMFGRLSAKQPTTLEQQMTNLVETLEDVAAAFSRGKWKATRRRLEALENERTQALFGDLLRRK